MAENRNFCPDSEGLLSRDGVCIDCQRVLDSCRDKDCFEDVRVYLTDAGQEIIEKTQSIRVKMSKIIWTSIAVEPVQFNRGFYQVYIRFYVKLCCEACVCPGKSADFEGIAICEKKVILWGSEGNVNIFRSDPNNTGFCSDVPFTEQYSNNLPTAVCEVVDPICLNIKVICAHEHHHHCCCGVEDIPRHVCGCINGDLTDCGEEHKELVASLGFFSVIRIERPGQYIVKADEYSVPDKICVDAGENDPCSVFKRMAFPTVEFSPPPYRPSDDSGRERCGCDKKR